MTSKLVARNGKPKNTLLSFVIEPELYRHLIRGIIGGQGTKSVNALDGPRGRLVQRWDTTRLFHLNVCGMAVAHYVERDIHPLRGRYARVDFVFQPVLRNFLLHHADIPGIARSEIAATAGKTETTLGSVGAEGAIRYADRPAMPEGNHVFGLNLGLGLRLLMRGSVLQYRLDLGGLVRNRNRVRFLLHRLGLRLRESLGIV